MSQRPPPFAALRALEAACRHRNYTAAAAELNVTHSAISQAIRRLEEEMGCKLFNRRGSAMEPSSASLALARAYADASVSLTRAIRHVTDGDPNALNLAAPPLVVRQLLLPVLARLQLRFPSIGLRLNTESLMDADADVIVQAREPSEAGRAVRLFQSRLRAYASLALLRGRPGLTPAEVTRAGLLIQGGDQDWESWLQAAGAPSRPTRQAMRFDDSSGLAMETAAQGLGVVLADSLAAAPYVERGALVLVCPDVSIAGPALWAAWASDHPKAEIIGELLQWWSREIDSLVASAEGETGLTPRAGRRLA